MSLNLTNVPVQKVASLGGKKHRYTSLKVNEVSLVTTPAIMGEDEPAANLLPVIKMVESAVTEVVTKSLDLQPDDDALKALEVLEYSAAKAIREEYPEDSAAWWVRLMRVAGSECVLSDNIWDTRDLFDGSFVAWRCQFTRTASEDLAYTITNIEKVGVQFTPLTEATKSAGEVPGAEEQDMQLFTVKLDGGVQFQWPAVKGQEVKAGEDSLVCKCEEDGEVVLGEGYTLEGEVISKVAKAEEPKAEVAKVEEPEAEVAKAEVAKAEEPEAKKIDVAKYFTPETLNAIMQGGGSVQLQLGEGNVLTIAAPAQKREEPQVETEKAAPEKAPSEKTDVETLKAEITQLQQELQGRVAEGGETYETQKSQPAHAGLFTRHLIGRGSEILPAWNPQKT